jgi:hypothetical protein
MRIFLSPQRRDDPFEVIKSGDTLKINGVIFNLSQIGEGDTLPQGAVDSLWFVGPVDRINGELILTLLFPNPWNYSQAQAFPVPLENVPDGPVVFPAPNMPDGQTYDPPEVSPGVEELDGVIDWSQLITKAMKDAAIAAQALSLAKIELQSRSARAATQIARIQDRIDTIGFGIDVGEATPEEEAEQVALAAPLKAWKVYKYALGKVTVQPTWYQAPVWPLEPPITEIIAAPMLASTETI